MIAESVFAAGPVVPPAVMLSALRRTLTVPSLEQVTVRVTEDPDALLGENVQPVAVVFAVTASKSPATTPLALAEKVIPYVNVREFDELALDASQVADGLLTIENDWVTLGAAAYVASPLCDA
jgi:hypothetical protein